jgi:thioredoxin reductase (NADPH)
MSLSQGEKDYDVVIVGGGPAGLSAGIYTARDRLKSLLIEKAAVGGRIINAEKVENYPGFPEGVSGLDLTQSMHQQAARFGLETVNTEVTALEVSGARKIVRTSEGDFYARAVIIAGGLVQEKLNVPGETEFTGRGVSYCATCDGAFFREKTVAVVGGGNSAISESLQLTRFASRVIVIHRRRELRATRILQEKALAEPKIEFLWDSVVTGIVGEAFVKKVKIRNVVTGQESTVDVSGVFISVGFKPSTGYLRGVLSLDDTGAVITNDRMETSVPGIFAAGDIRSRSIRQAIAAAGDGAAAAVYAERYLAG